MNWNLEKEWAKRFDEILDESTYNEQKSKKGGGAYT